jgi:hypothetical protein
MKKLVFAMVLSIVCLSQANAAILSRRLQCNEPSSSRGSLLGVSYFVEAVSRSAISGNGTKFYLAKRAVVPNADVTREELSLTGEQNDWLQLSGPSGTVHVKKDFTAAKVDFSNGYSSICQ